MKAADLRKKTTQELEDELLALSKESFSLRMQKATGQLGRPSQFGVLRRDIARIKTVLGERAAGRA